MHVRRAGRRRHRGPIFATGAGTHRGRYNLSQRSFKPLLNRAELPEIRFHDLRHTCATLLLSKGVHPKFVQELLGHATIAITLDTYSHVLPGMGNQTAVAMEAALDGVRCRKKLGDAAEGLQSKCQHSCRQRFNGF